jgi:hypothetical protein
MLRFVLNQSKQNQNKKYVESIDCFDTLVARYHGSPKKFYQHVERLSQYKGFTKARISADIECGMKTSQHMTLNDVYNVVQRQLGLSDKQKEDLMRLGEFKFLLFDLFRMARRAKIHLTN